MLNSVEREDYAKSIFSTIEQSDFFGSSYTIALYASLPDELPTSSVIKRWSCHKRILLPRVGSDCQMEFFEYDPTQISKGAYGISEPEGEVSTPIEEIDIIIVPGVAFTLEGARLGRGKGYYDRYLSRTKNRAYTFGVCYLHQIIDSIPVEPHDVILDEVITVL